MHACVMNMEWNMPWYVRICILHVIRLRVNSNSNTFYILQELTVIIPVTVIDECVPAIIAHSGH